ncbi:MAG: hypothetical protein OP8BY_1604 [Candidatus Saccharicenans subterraneus]|uniref:Uncharacterized protein n=1 Tax=Candidatus Saccharicenans subterraneus TaxID=2508984 RepID=A0A3E2BP66_9BACT|nr:MAG: hypothetical protein OP8BY_1604 [Candidatus Saccharicenans subterraneum]
MKRTEVKIALPLIREKPVGLCGEPARSRPTILVSRVVIGMAPGVYLRSLQ